MSKGVLVLQRVEESLDWYQGGESLITDELGMPVPPHGNQRAASHTGETTLACGDVARSEELEPPTF
jgi:hypothetical protein